MLRPTSSVPTFRAPADVSSLVELAARMGVPTDYAIHRFIDLGVHGISVAHGPAPERIVRTGRLTT